MDQQTETTTTAEMTTPEQTTELKQPSPRPQSKAEKQAQFDAWLESRIEAAPLEEDAGAAAEEVAADEPAQAEPESAEPKEEEKPALSKQHLRLLEKEKKLRQREEVITTKQAQVDDFMNRLEWAKQNMSRDPDRALRAVGLSMEWLVQAAQGRAAHPAQHQASSSDPVIEELRNELKALKEERSQASLQTVAASVRSGITEEIAKGGYKNLKGDPAQYVEDVYEEIQMLASRMPGDKQPTAAEWDELYVKAAKRVDKLKAAEAPGTAAAPKKIVGTQTLGSKVPAPSVAPKSNDGRKETFDEWALRKGLS